MSSIYRRVNELIFDNWDVAVIWLFLIFMTVQAFELPEIPRQFPLVFLIFATVAMTIELAIQLLPPKYADPIDRLTTGIAHDIETETKDLEEKNETKGEDGSVDESSIVEMDREDPMVVLILSIMLVLGFGVLAYYISFLLAIPIFVYGVFFLIGTKNFRNATLTTIFLMIFIYYIFGAMMAVPIDTGEIIGAEDIINSLR